jgi:hypothetical protein
MGFPPAWHRVGKGCWLAQGQNFAWDLHLRKGGSDGFDIPYVDATETIHSPAAAGAVVKLLRSIDKEMTFIRQ